MPNKDNHIYDKQTRTWFDVTPEQFQEYDRWRTRIRKREQAHGHCMCPRSKWWLCDGMCQDCEFHAAGDTISLDAPVANDDGDEVSLGDTLMDPDSLFDSILCDKAEMDMLFARLEELIFHLKDGTERKTEWQLESRSKIWTPEMKAKAAENARRRGHGKKCD